MLSVQVKIKPMLAALGNQADIDVIDTFYSIYRGVCALITKRMFLQDQRKALKDTFCFISKEKIDIIDHLFCRVKV